MTEITKGETTVTQLQTIVEREKSALARAIHDELGGYLIASAMDVTNLRHRFATHDDDTRSKFDRLSKMLNGAIDMMRRVTEELHPTLLDNVGLFAALRWQLKNMCDHSGISCIAHLPDTELLLSPAAAIMLFRVGQEALIFAKIHPGVRHLDFTIRIDNDFLLIRVVTDGTEGPQPEANIGDDALGFLGHRIEAMGGEVFVTYPGGGGISLRAQVLLAAALAFH